MERYETEARTAKWRVRRAPTTWDGKVVSRARVLVGGQGTGRVKPCLCWWRRRWLLVAGRHSHLGEASHGRGGSD